METKITQAVTAALSWAAAHGRDNAGYQIDLCDIAKLIAEQVPIAGESATDDEVTRRSQLVTEVLDALIVGTYGASARPQAERAWWTVVAESAPREAVPPFGGVWAHSREEALIECFLWRPELRRRHIAQAFVEHGVPQVYNSLRRQTEREARRAELDATAVTLW